MMEPEEQLPLLTHFASLEDPRTRESLYRLDELLLVAICAVLSGADGWTDVAMWGRAKLSWLRRFLPFENGIASHDTFGRVFALLDAGIFEQCFIDWMCSICTALDGMTVSIDGKTVRRSRSKSNQAIHMVSAYANGLGLTLGQVRAAEKSNEITAIPELLDALLLKGSIVTIDAMGCQTAIANRIVAKKAHYVLAVKNNQPTLAQTIEGFFDDAARTGWENCTHSYAEWISKDHGRIETRRCWVSGELPDLGEAWATARTVIKVEATREIAGKRHVEWRYYLSSLEANAERMGAIVRGHWGIENSLHWVLDVAYGEDQSRMREGNSAENFSILRRITLNLLKQDRSVKAGIKGRRLMSGWDDAYREKLLGLQPLA